METKFSSNVLKGNIVDKPIEYFVAQSINPYLTEEERKESSNILCQRIINDVEGPQIAAKCFSHKITSPDHVEVSLALDVIEYSLRVCGYRLAVDLGKYRFLNSMIKLLSPRYLGNETPQTIKNKVIVMLYGWQKYIGHIGNFKEVYMLLKKQNLITSDPKVQIEDYVIESKKPVKMACFEDEEKSKLLASLLASKKIEDLQAANRLIKSLVRTEEKKTERKIKKMKDIDKAKEYICILYELLNNYSSATTTPEECRTIGELYSKTSKLQPIIQSYANETEDYESDFLGELLEVNDDILRVIEIYDKLFKYAEESKNKNDIVIHQNKDTGSDIKKVTWSDESEGSSLETVVNDDDDDDILSIWSRQTTPQISRKIMKPSIVLNSNDSCNKNLRKDYSNKELNKRYNLICEDLQDLEFSSITTIPQVDFKVKEDDVDPGLFLENFSVDVNDLEIETKDPLTIFDAYNIRIVLYYTKSKIKLQYKNTFITFVTITNFSTQMLSEIKFLIQSRAKIVNCKLEKTQCTELHPFNPLSAIKSINQIFYILPLSDNIQKCDFNFKLNFISKNNRYEEFGQFTLNLI
uniref:VHS domain-containing protein n=1 Tax=Parastrongyloides trichosuri TaxID=131310 RepID=A0A0N4ZHR2_PARTI